MPWPMVMRVGRWGSTLGVSINLSPSRAWAGSCHYHEPAVSHSRSGAEGLEQAGHTGWPRNGRRALDLARREEHEPTGRLDVPALAAMLAGGARAGVIDGIDDVVRVGVGRALHPEQAVRSQPAYVGLVLGAADGRGVGRAGLAGRAGGGLLHLSEPPYTY